MTAMQGMFKQRNEAIEQSVKNHDPKSEYAIEKYLKENNLDIEKLEYFDNHCLVRHKWV